MPYQKHPIRGITFSKEEQILIALEIEKLIDKGDIYEVERTKDEFISNIFVRPKKDGSHRIIFNVKKLNEDIEHHHFKMDTLKSALQILKPNCWFASIDLKDAYYSISVALEDRKYLRFLWNDKCFEFSCLPMGLTSSPRVFTKLLKPVFSILHQRGFSSVIYIDDILLVGDTFEDCEANIRNTMSMLDNLGFTVHPGKSMLTPTQNIPFLGFNLNSLNMTVRLLPDKAQDIVDLCNSLICRKEIKLRELAKIIGKFVAATPGVQYAQLHYKSLEIEKDKHLKLVRGDYEAKCTLSQESVTELVWWKNNIHDSCGFLIEKDVNLTIQTDSSLSGWGAYVVETKQKTGGHWSYIEQNAHINILELKAAFLALQSFCTPKNDIHVSLQMDNMVAVSYINNMGGRKCELNSLCKQIWDWCINRDIYISAKHLPGVENVQADRLSRKLNDDMEWMLNDNTFEKIMTIYSLKNGIDLFASRLNYRLPLYVSYLPDPNAIAVDAFSMKWNTNFMYMFPPFSILGRVLAKINQDKAEAVMVAPIWPTQHWFPLLLNMISEQSYILPRSSKTLLMPTNMSRQHPLKKMYLGCFRLSGNCWRAKEYRMKLSTQLPAHGANQPESSIGHISKNGCHFVIGTRVIHLRHLL
ncbi:hypothetical protein FSP39_020111 [Pinctada imbricata]|uniref:Reverse transcriptase domain-containing protein n=1 Tax=Pinctada imbricata TaxID=66713 RepID=A0AA88Y9A1_PINIB|nr:hypothetical protein FSP39_020111 [Pinctada imbricata]